MQTKALLALLFTVVVWGIGPVFIRSLSVALGPGDHLVIRYGIVSLIYAVGLLVMGNWRIAREDWPRLLLLSLVGMLGYNLGSAFGFEKVTAGIGSLIIGTQPLLIALLGSVIAREKLSLPAIAGLALAFSGTGLLVWRDIGFGNGGNTMLLGSAFVFVSGLCWALYVVLTKPLIRKYGAYSISAWSIIIATLAMMAMLARPSTLHTIQGMSVSNWLDMAYMAGLSTLIAAISWNYGSSRLPAATAGAFIYLVPIIGVTAGALMLGETITPAMLMGGALILAGVALAQFGPMLRLKGSAMGLPAIIFAVTMWGLIPVAMRYLILGLSPQTAMVLRLYPAGLIAITVLLIVGVRRIEWRDWGRIAIAAFAGNLGYQVLAAFGMKSVPASWTGLLFGLEPVFIALFAVILAGEKLTTWLVAGMGLALLGTLALMLGSSFVPTGDVSLTGLILVTLSTMGWGIYTVVIRPVSRKYGAFQVACLAMGLSALPMVFFVTPEFPQAVASMQTTQWLAVGFVVIFGTFLATSAWNYALGHMESSIAGIFLYVQPIVAALGGMLLLGEQLTWPLLAGGALIIAGVAVAQFGPLINAPIKRSHLAAQPG
ncbi:DMT family transporter [Aestuariivirga sp.]|uniref:DMT family transporter n=1 Tax=Aestuariivirga sp. TaxID=2650926 RepID=UPI0039E58A9C